MAINEYISTIRLLDRSPPIELGGSINQRTLLISVWNRLILSQNIPILAVGHVYSIELDNTVIFYLFTTILSTVFALVWPFRKMSEIYPLFQLFIKYI